MLSAPVPYHLHLGGWPYPRKRHRSKAICTEGTVLYARYLQGCGRGGYCMCGS